MNYIWAVMMMLGIGFSICSGTLSELGQSMMESCEEAIWFLIGMAGVMGMWSGLMNVAKKTGLIQSMTGMFRPLTRRLFPQVNDQETISAMVMSFAANLMGAGNSATVFSLKAMELLDRENGGRPEASNAMCMFLVLNMYMVQLIPMTVLKVRQDAGSASPESIVVPAMIVEAATMVLAVVLCRLLEKRGRGNRL